MKFSIIYKEEYPWDVRVEKIAKTLADHGHDVTILARNLRQEETNIKIGKIQVHRLPNTANLPKIIQRMANIALFFNPFWLYYIYKSTSGNGRPIIIVRDLPLMAAGILVARLLNTQVVFDMAECYPEMYASIREFSSQSFFKKIFKNQSLASFYEIQACRLANHIFVVIDESKKRLELKGILSEKITIVSNTPEVDIHKEYKVQHQGKNLRIIYVGFVTRLRGIDILIKSVQKFIQAIGDCDGIRVDIIGEGRAKTELVHLAKELKLENVVNIHGWLEKEEVELLMSQANVGALTYRVCRHWNNTIPNKIFDYMQAGLPVIATEVIPIKRILQDTGAGLICRDQDVDDIALKLLELRDPRTRQDLGNNGVKAVLGKYNWKRDRERMIQALERLGM